MNGLFRDAFTILFARGFIRLAQLLSFVLLARFLTPAEFGWFGIVTTAIALAATLGSLGLRQAIAHEIGQGRLTPGEGTGTVLAVWPLLALVSSFAVFLAYGTDLPGFSPHQSAAAVLVGVSSSMLVVMLQGVLLGRGDIRAFSKTETFPRVLLALLALGLAAGAAVSVTTAIWAYAISFAATTLLSLRLALGGWSGIKARLGKLGRLIWYGAIFAVNLFLVTLCSRLSMFVIEHHYDSSQAGKFFAAVRVNEIILEAATAFGLALFSKSVRSNESDAVIAKTARISCWIFWSFNLGAGLIAWFAPLVLNLLLGDGYTDSGSALRVLAAGIGAAAANKIIYPSIAGQGRPLFGSPIIVVSLLVNLAFAWSLVPSFGVTGGAAALVIGQYAMLGGYVIACHKKFGVPVARFFIPHKSDIRSVLEQTRARFTKQRK